MNAIETNHYNTLFLDRDGVINIERPNDYVKDVSEFIFLNGSIEAIAKLTFKFNHIFIITNQRGVGRNIMNQKDLEEVHKFMIQKIENVGGNITKIYTCTDIENSSINRKPNIGMAYKAKADYPDIKFNKSIMIGNSRSDIEFGKKLGMYTVLVGDKYQPNDKLYSLVDCYCENLYMFASTIL